MIPVERGERVYEPPHFLGVAGIPSWADTITLTNRRLHLWVGNSINRTIDLGDVVKAYSYRRLYRSDLVIIGGFCLFGGLWIIGTGAALGMVVGLAVLALATYALLIAGVGTYGVRLHLADGSWTQVDNRSRQTNLESVNPVQTDS